MTVIVGGYEFSSLTFWNGGVSGATQPTTNNKLVVQSTNTCSAVGPKPSTAFLVGDSLLSSSTQSGSRVVRARREKKVRQYDICISKPELAVDGRVTSRLIESYRDSCGIAYSGSNLFFTQVDAAFRQQLRELRYTYKFETLRVPARYAILLPHHADFLYDTENFRVKPSIAFSSLDLPKLKACTIAELLAQCVQVVVNDVFSALLERDETVKSEDFAEFALSTYCRESDRPILFGVDIVRDNSVSPPWLKARVRKLADDDLLVLGKTSWKQQFVQSRSAAVAAGESIMSEIRNTCKTLVGTNVSQNYVGGEITSGWADSFGGFRLGTPVGW